MASYTGRNIDAVTTLRVAASASYSCRCFTDDFQALFTARKPQARRQGVR